MRLLNHITRHAALLCFMTSLAAATASAQTQTFTATAALRATPATSLPLTVEVQKFATDAERDALLAALQGGGTASARAFLASKPDIGSLQLGTTRVPLKYAYSRTTGDGQLITVVTAAAIPLTGAAATGASGAANGVGLALLEVHRTGAGVGELLPSTTVKASAERTLVTDEAGAKGFSLTNVTKK